MKGGQRQGAGTKGWRWEGEACASISSRGEAKSERG